MEGTSSLFLMKYRKAIVIVIGMLLCTVPSIADEKTAQDERKAQGVDLVTDAAAALVNKGFAMLSGKLEVTVNTDNDRIKNKNNYTQNILGQSVPKSTAINNMPVKNQSTGPEEKKLLKATL